MDETTGENHSKFTASADAAQPRRYKSFCVSPEVLQDLLTTGASSHFVCEKGIPVGAKFIYAYVNYYSFSHIIYLVFEHESFDEVLPGASIPYGEAWVKQIYDDSAN